MDIIASDMKHLLKEISRAVLKEQSSQIDPDKILDAKEILLFISQYLNAMTRIRETTGENPFGSSSTDQIEEQESGEILDLQVTESDCTGNV